MVIDSKATPVTGIDMSGYMVKDAARAIAFYRDVAALEPARIYPENRGAEFDLADGTTFGLWGGGDQSGIPFQPSNGVLFAVADVEAIAAALVERKIPIVAKFDLPHCSMVAINDTEGNTVFFHQRRSA